MSSRFAYWSVLLIACSETPPTAAPDVFVPSPSDKIILDAGVKEVADLSDAADTGSETGQDLGAGTDTGPSLDLGASPDMGPNPDPDLGPGPDAGAPECSAGNNMGWVKLGAALNAQPGPDIHPTSVALTIDDAPVVAWTEGSPADLYIHRFDGTSWVPMGAPLSENPDNTNTYNPSLAAGAGQLVVFFAESGGTNGTGAYARRWTGSSWELMGGGDLSTDATSVVGADVAIDDNGDPVIAFSQGSPRRIIVRRFSGLAYIPLNPELGGIPGPGASAITPFLSFDQGGRLIIAFSESGVRTFQRNPMDTDWAPLGAGEIIPLGTSAHTPRMKRRGAGADPIIALEEYDGTASNTYVYAWTGSMWSPLGAEINRLTGSSHTNLKAITVDPNDRPIVAWTEGEDNMRTQLFIQRLENGSFQDLGTMPLTAFSAMDSVTDAEMEIDGCGRPVIAFIEGPSGGERTIHVYRYYGP